MTPNLVPGQRLKIAQFIDSFDNGGAETLLIQLSVQLVKLGHSVTVLHLGNPFIADYCETHGLDHEQLPFGNNFKSSLKLPIFIGQFARYLKQHHFNVLHTHLYGALVGTTLSAKLAGVTHVATLHDVYMIDDKPSRIHLVKLAIRNGSHVVAVSGHMQRFYNAKLPLGTRVGLVTNGLVNTLSQTDIDRTRSLGPKKPIRVITVGRLVSIKQQIAQLNALAPFIKQGIMRLSFVGDGPDFDALQHIVETQGLQQQVELFGNRDDVDKLLLSHDVFMLASQTEGLSCSIMEAMHAGLPCIVTRVGGNSELIQHGVNGFLVELATLPQLGKWVQELVNNTSLYRQMSVETRHLAKSRFSIQSMTQQYLSSYYQSI